MKRPLILIVDDEPNIVKFVSSILRAGGYDVVAARNGAQALNLATYTSLDLVILDLMLPGINGLEVCRRLRTVSEVPVIILSAKGEDSAKVEALNLGADDYLTKPFSTGELLARVRAVLRRVRRVAPEPVAQHVSCGSFELDPETRYLIMPGKRTKLSRTEFDLLRYLMRHASKIVPHHVLLGDIWGPEYRDETEYLHVYIGRLRQKLEPDPANPRYLLTEPGFGYVFHPDPASNQHKELP